VLSVREVLEQRPSHVVFMGMGEPLLNIEAVLEAIHCLCTDLGMAQQPDHREHGGRAAYAPPLGGVGARSVSAAPSSPWR